jgi:stage V sporulation protein AB
MFHNPVASNLVLALIGISAGGIIAAGVFAFLVVIGVYPRLIGNSQTHRHILLYETVIILGGVMGNVADLYEIPIPFGGNVMLGIFGASVGIYVGGVAMALAETLKALPVISRRIRLGVGLQYIILAIAAGKTAGALLYFYRNLSA